MFRIQNDEALRGPWRGAEHAETRTPGGQAHRVSVLARCDISGMQPVISRVQAHASSNRVLTHATKTGPPGSLEAQSGKAELQRNTPRHRFPCSPAPVAQGVPAASLTNAADKEAQQGTKLSLGFAWLTWLQLLHFALIEQKTECQYQVMLEEAY